MLPETSTDLLLKIVKLPGTDRERVPTMGALVRPSESVASLKAKIAQSYPWPVQRQILFFHQIVLEDDKSFEFYGIPFAFEPVLQLLLRPVPGPAPAPAPRPALAVAPSPPPMPSPSLAHSAPLSEPHHATTCSACRSPVVGIRYKCANCPNFDLCERCEARNTHPTSHVFLKCRLPLQPIPLHEVLLPRLIVAGSRPDASWHRPSAATARTETTYAGPRPHTAPALSLAARCRLDTYRHMLRVGVPEQAVAGKVRVMEGALASAFLRELFPGSFAVTAAASAPALASQLCFPSTGLSGRAQVYARMLRVGVPLAAVVQKVKAAEGVLAEAVLRELQCQQPAPPAPAAVFVPVPPPQPQAKPAVQASVVKPHRPTVPQPSPPAAAAHPAIQAQIAAVNSALASKLRPARRPVFPAEYALLCEMGFVPVTAARVLHSHNGQLAPALAELLGSQ